MLLASRVACYLKMRSCLHIHACNKVFSNVHFIPINEDMGVVSKYIGSASEEVSNHCVSGGAEGRTEGGREGDLATVTRLHWREPKRLPL